MPAPLRPSRQPPAAPEPRRPTLGLPILSVRMVTLLTVPQLEKCICSSSGVQP
jgi:hypothetical protein